MFKLLRPKCVIPRAIRNPRAFYRWTRIKWAKRVRVAEKELGEKIQCC